MAQINRETQELSNRKIDRIYFNCEFLKEALIFAQRFLNIFFGYIGQFLEVQWTKIPLYFPLQHLYIEYSSWYTKQIYQNAKGFNKTKKNFYSTEYWLNIYSNYFFLP